MFPINSFLQTRLHMLLSPDDGGSAGAGKSDGSTNEGSGKNEQEQKIDTQILLDQRVPGIDDKTLDSLIDDQNPDRLKEIINKPPETPEQKQEREKTEKEAAEQARLDEEEFNRQVDASKVPGESEDQKKARIDLMRKEREEKKHTSEKLFANKYKTADQLVEGFTSAAKVLNYNQKFIDTLVEYAKKYGDYSHLEMLYPELDKAISANQKAAGETHTQDERTQSDRVGTSDSPTVDANVRSEMARLAVEGTLQGLSALPVGRELAAAEITLPDDFLYNKDTTATFMNKLRAEEPVIFIHLEKAIVDSWNKNMKEVQDVYAALNDSEVKNPQLIASETEKIKATAKEIGLTMKDEDLKSYVESLLDKPEIFELKNGVRFVRPDSISKRWITDNFDTIKKQIKLNAQIEGRKQAAEDLKSHSNRIPGSISNTDIPTDQRSRQKKTGTIDVKDEKQKEALTDEQLDHYIEHGLPVPS